MKKQIGSVIDHSNSIHCEAQVVQKRSFHMILILISKMAVLGSLHIYLFWDKLVCFGRRNSIVLLHCIYKLPNTNDKSFFLNPL
jgi:hypothetical protein